MKGKMKGNVSVSSTVHVLLVLFFTIFLTSTAATATLVRIPLNRREASNTRTTATDKAKYTQGLYVSKSGTPPTVPIFNGKIEMLYITLGIGTPPQFFNVTVNTGEGTSNFWVPSAECDKKDCPVHLSKYYHNRSSTYIENGTKYEGGGTSGYLSQDTVHLGGLNVYQTFGEALKFVSSNELRNIDGMLGLSVQPTGPTGTPLFLNLFKQKLITQMVFGMYVAPLNDAHHKTGELILGGRDPKHYMGELSYTPLTSKAYWQFILNTISVDKKTNRTEFCQSRCTAVIDSGTALIVGPKKDVDALNKELGAVTDPTTNNAYFNCSTLSSLPDITMSIAGRVMQLTWREYVYSIDSPPMCVSGFAGIDQEEWILGRVFLQAVYIEFDAGNSRLGFAPSK